MTRALAATSALLLSGCATYATDPSERGLSYVASAIVFAAIIRALFNH